MGGEARFRTVAAVALTLALTSLLASGEAVGQPIGSTGSASLGGLEHAESSSSLGENDVIDLDDGGSKVKTVVKKHLKEGTSANKVSQLAKDLHFFRDTKSAGTVNMELDRWVGHLSDAAFAVRGIPASQARKDAKNKLDLAAIELQKLSTADTHLKMIRSKIATLINNAYDIRSRKPHDTVQ